MTKPDPKAPRPPAPPVPTVRGFYLQLDPREGYTLSVIELPLDVAQKHVVKAFLPDVRPIVLSKLAMAAEDICNDLREKS